MTHLKRYMSGIIFTLFLGAVLASLSIIWGVFKESFTYLGLISTIAVTVAVPYFIGFIIDRITLRSQENRIKRKKTAMENNKGVFEKEKNEAEKREDNIIYFKR